MNKAKVALIYDFDKTLSTNDMQTYGFIPSFGYTTEEFWDLCSVFTKENKVDNILSSLYMMQKVAKDNGVRFTKEYLKEFGKNIEYYKGVQSWFERINSYAESIGIELEHYIVSSGVKEIILGTDIAKFFKEIFACYYAYENGEAIWPAVSINYTNKTQFLYRINKGIYDILDQSVNEEMLEEDRPIPFTNMIYIGDSMTDIPSMRLVVKSGGTAIGLYQPETENESYLRTLLSRNRISFVAESDYSEGKELDTIVKMVLKKVKNDADMKQFKLQEILKIRNK